MEELSVLSSGNEHFETKEFILNSNDAISDISTLTTLLRNTSTEQHKTFQLSLRKRLREIARMYGIPVSGKD